MINKKKIAIVLGTRPEIIKLCSLIRSCVKNNTDFFIIHTNQHYSENMDKIFFDGLNLPLPKYNLDVGSGPHGKQTGLMIAGIEEILLSEKPDIVVVQGDTNSALAGALAAAKIHIKVAHVEAGLRSYDRRMPEEINRVIIDHISELLFTPTENQKRILIDEGIKKNNIFISGNTIVDAVLQNTSLSKKIKKLIFEKHTYFLLTLHREENTDNKDILRELMETIGEVYKKYQLPIIYPIHPRTLKMLNTYNITVPKGVVTSEPLGYLEFLQLIKEAKVILTDSGGVQEEACILGTPCVTLRNNTERPETVKVGANIIAGTKKKKILKSLDKMVKNKKKWKNPFGNGKAGDRIRIGCILA